MSNHSSVTRSLIRTLGFAFAASSAWAQTPAGEASPAPAPLRAQAPRAAPSPPASPAPFTAGPTTSQAGVTYDVLWWDATPEYFGQAPDSLRELMSDYLDDLDGGTVFDSTYVSSEIPGELAAHLASNSYDVIVFDVTGPNTFDGADLTAVTDFYLSHTNVLLDGILYIRSIDFDASTDFPGINGSSGGFTSNEVWQLATRGGGVMIGTDHDCCQAGANLLLGAMVPGAMITGLTTPSLDGAFNGNDLLDAVETVSAFDLFTHWSNVPSQAETPVGMFTDVAGNPVEFYSQVEVADFVGGPRRPYISTTWDPEGKAPEFDCNDNGILDSEDIASGFSLDENCNTIPDECESTGMRYCSPQEANSTGGAATIVVVGSSIISDGDLTLTACGAPAGMLGYFLVSTSSGLIDLPAAGLSSGFLCLGTGKGRFLGQAGVTSAAGAMSPTSVDLTSVPLSSGPDYAVAPGQTLYFQGWFRDSAASPGNNFTDAVAVTFL